MKDTPGNQKQLQWKIWRKILIKGTTQTWHNQRPPFIIILKGWYLTSHIVMLHIRYKHKFLKIRDTHRHEGWCKISNTISSVVFDPSALYCANDWRSTNAGHLLRNQHMLNSLNSIIWPHTWFVEFVTCGCVFIPPWTCGFCYKETSESGYVGI